MSSLIGTALTKRYGQRDVVRSVDLEVTPSGMELIEKDPMGLVLEAASQLSRDECETMNAALGRVVADLQRAIGLPEFGPCLDCVHFCVEHAAPEAQSVCRCALNGDELPFHDLHLVCAKFESVA